MTRQRYNTTESWNRILRLFQGKAVATDQPATMQGEILSVDEAQSDLAELLGGSLPSETAELPASLVATVDEANEDVATINTRAMTPASHQWAHEYGGIYTATGTTSIIVLTANSWTKITGTFKGYMLDSGSEIDCDWNDDRIIVNEVGTYLVMYNFSLLSLGNQVNLDMQAFVNGVGQPQTASRTFFNLSGTVGATQRLSAFGFIPIISGGYAVDVRAKSDVNITITTYTAQLLVQRAVG